MFLFTDLADRFAVRQVVCDDFSQFRKVPAVPLPAAHNVVVELLIQVIQKSWRKGEKKILIWLIYKEKTALVSHQYLSAYFKSLSYNLQMAWTIIVSTLSGLNFSL